MLSPTFIDEMQQLLEKRKKELEQERAGLKSHTEMGDDYDENALEISVDEANQDILARIDADLVKINAALERISQGTYGIDDEGREISEERLRALPWADKAI